MFDPSQPAPTPFPCGLHFLHANLQPQQQERAALAGAAILVATLPQDCTLGTALSALGTQLELPEWYEHTLDSLYACLCDLSWEGAPDTTDGLCLAIRGVEHLAEHDPEGWYELAEALFAITLVWGHLGTACSILVDAPLPRAR